MPPPSSRSPQPLNGNGHRRRQIRARVLAEEHDCALCGLPVDKTIPYPLPGSPVVDEDMPRSRGGSQYDRANTHLMHNACNRLKSTRTLEEVKAMSSAPQPSVQASPDW